MEKCTNRLCSCHRMTTSTAAGQQYFTHYGSPNIVIVPTVSFTNCTPAKKTKLSDECQNSTHANKVPTIPDTHMNCEVSSNNDNSASVKHKSKTAKIKNSSWASNYLQSIGQPQTSISSMSKKAFICVPDRSPEKTNSKNNLNKKEITQSHVNKNVKPFRKGVEKMNDIDNRVTSLLSSIIPGTSGENREKKENTLLTATLKNQTNSGQNITNKVIKNKNTYNLFTKRKHDAKKNNINEYSPTIKRVNKGSGVNDNNIQLKTIRGKGDNHDGKRYKEKKIISTPNIHCKKLTTSFLLSSIIPGTSAENREKKANTLPTATLKNQTNSGQNIANKIVKNENTYNLFKKRKHDAEKNYNNEYSPTIKRVNKRSGVNDNNIQLKTIHGKGDNHDGKRYKEKEIISTPNIHCKKDVNKDSINKINKPTKDLNRILSSSCKTAKDIKHKTGLKKPCFKCTSIHKNEQNLKTKHKIHKSKNANITKVSQESHSKKSKEKTLQEISLKKDKPNKHSESSTLVIKDGARLTSENLDTAGKTNTKKFIKSVVQTTNSFDCNKTTKNNYEEQQEKEDLRIKLNRSHYTKRRDNLLVTVPNTTEYQNETMQIEHSSEHPKVKTIKLIINLICNKTENTKLKEENTNLKEENTKNENRQLASVDLSFLDDFNVDDIVESLNYQEDTSKLPSADNQSVIKTAEPSNLLENIKDRVIDVEMESTCSREIPKQTENAIQSSVKNNVFNYCDGCRVKKEKIKHENEKVQLHIKKLDESCCKNTLIISNKLHVHDRTTIDTEKDIIIIKEPYEVKSENTDGSSKYTKEDMKDSNTETISHNDNFNINYKTSVKLEEITPNNVAFFTEFTPENKNYNYDNNSNAVIDEVIIIEDTYENRNEITDGRSKYTKEEIKGSKIKTIDHNENSNINHKTCVKSEVPAYSMASSSKLTLVDKNCNYTNNSNAVINKNVIIIEDTYENINENTDDSSKYTEEKIKDVNYSTIKTICLDDNSKINNQTNVNLEEVAPNKIASSPELTSIDKNYNILESAKIDSPKCTLLTVKTSKSTHCDSQLQENKTIKQELHGNVKEPNNKDTEKLDMGIDFKMNEQVDNKLCRGSYMILANTVETNLKVLNSITTSLLRNDLPHAHLDTEISKNSKHNNPSDPSKSKGNVKENISSLIEAVSATTEVQVQDEDKTELKEIKKSTVKSVMGIEENSVSKNPLHIPFKPYDVILKEILETRMHQYLGIKYDIRSLIHTGKYSKIFHCKNSYEENYAVKVLNKTEDCYSMGIRKEDMIKSLQRDIPKENLNCIFLIDGFAIKNHWCFLMDYYPRNLKQVLKETKGFHICMVQKLSRQLVSAVIVLRNNNIVHSDIKPGHILLNSSLDRLKICGFDGFRYVDQVTLLPNIGTASYRAPEIILGHSDGFSIDVWSTALVMFEMVTAHKLFPGVFNNDILFQQMCMLGNIPCEMIQTSLYKEHHYCGSVFKRRTGYKGMTIVFVSKFNKTPYNIVSAVFKAYHKYYNSYKTKLEKIQDNELIKSFLRLLEQMIVLDPNRRLPIEFVYANEFIFENFGNE